jgi:predicted transcriptional regulator of viral defense system
MDFEQLLALVGDEPLFESAVLLAGKVKPAAIRLQLSRWTKNGRIYQLRRGLYALAPPYQKTEPHPFVIANAIQRASYVSGVSALAFFGLIPEIVRVTVSVTAGRPSHVITPLGVYEYRHIKPGLLQGYRMFDLGDKQQALVATPEKALIDLLYLQPGSDTPAYLEQLRLQNLERLDLAALHHHARAFASPKLQRAVETIERLSQMEALEYESL